MNLRGVRVTLHDMCLRDGMHPKRHQITVEQMVAVATALDAAGVPLIEVTHGDGLGGASITYGFPRCTDEEYLRAILPSLKLQQVIRAGAVVSEEEVQREYTYRTLRNKVQYAGVEWRSLEIEPFDPSPDELRAYFAGELRQFSLPLAPSGTEFQLDVWNALRAIPYGETTSYGELAKRIGRPAAVRAVGAANGANPLPIVVPCHRVIGSNGSLTGFGGGIPLKQALLELERDARDGQRSMFAARLKQS